jgi:hypothetical protein
MGEMCKQETWDVHDNENVEYDVELSMGSGRRLRSEWMERGWGNVVIGYHQRLGLGTQYSVHSKVTVRARSKNSKGMWRPQMEVDLALIIH